MGAPETLFVVKTNPLQAQDAATLLVPVWQAAQAPKTDEDDTPTPPAFQLEPAAQPIADALQLATLAQAEGFKAAVGQTLLARPQEGQVGNAKRVLFFGLGKASQLTRVAVGKPFETAVKSLLKLDESLHSAAILLPAPYEANGGALANDPETADTLDATTLTLAVVDAVVAATYKSAEAKKPSKPLPPVALVTQPATQTEVEEALPLALALAKGRTLAKDLVNKPANTKTTQTMVDAAKALQQEFPFLALTVVDDPEQIAREMPCFYEVAKGSVATDPPKFIHVRYTGENPTTKLAFVGKSVIFDTGGYQVKPGNSMVTMKGDMAGGASVLGALKVIALVKPANLQLDVYLAATPNRIDSGAMVPDAIVDTTCGKKVEIRHTDAEGRLTLIDAVAKAAAEKPDAIVTVATLTGAAMRAVGRTIALMSNHTRWQGKVLQAAQTAGDPVQVLDVTPEDFDNIKSKLDGADIRNTSKSDNRGAQSAAAFVMSGAPDEMPVVHLDIAGADMTSEETATAYSVRTLAHLALLLG